jgi:hypothetical protein
MNVYGQLHAPSDLPQRKETPGNHWKGAWVYPRVGLDAVDVDIYEYTSPGKDSNSRPQLIKRVVTVTGSDNALVNI